MRDDFVRGNDRLTGYLRTPERAQAVAAIRKEMDTEDRAYALNLAAIRKAADLTQKQLGERLGVGQNTVSRTERRSDVLWSTLVDYLSAAGGSDITLAVTINGQRIELDLDASHHTRN
ncbi:helix-turn-helix domain-containing protein [Oerskovia jenensis]|nr:MULTISPECIES: helix-turn-helix domain-containing protein [Oerskovia]MBD7998260.1 helix-turn-helix domain-containing protein [Oerskovia gallyi]MBM7495675.1 DNA-binding XRE family transcriptional regulator [Oerskovia paurometabola]